MVSVAMDTYDKLVKQAQTRAHQNDEDTKIIIHVGSATCENAAGAADVMDEIKKHISASGRTDITVCSTGCTGRCSCEPIVSVMIPGKMPVKYEKVDRDLVHEIFIQHIKDGQPVAEHILDGKGRTMSQYEFLFCSSAQCATQYDLDLKQAFVDKLNAAEIGEDTVKINHTSCFGLCSSDIKGKAVYILVRPSKTIYRVLEEADLDEIIETHIKGGQVVERLKIDDQPISQRFFDLYGGVPFFFRQSRIALRNSGIIDPEDLFQYVRFHGFEGLAKAIDQADPDATIDEITNSKLRGRGGGGFPTGIKWKNARAVESDVKYIICNADEGDPGAFMDRSMLEGDPFSIIEGMIIGGFCIGANKGYLYIRAEYPMAIERMENAIKQCRENGLLGDSVLGTGFAFDLEIRLGAGAFVCGEETALIHSIEGERGQPRIRPPYPAQKGLWGKPTVINNVETWASIPVIVNYGSEWFSAIGTEKSGGTKVFALAGKVNHTGLVEVPMGTTLREIVYDIGGGIPGGKKLKAIQTGGPAGGCIPAEMIDTPVDYDTLRDLGSIMGSGGMIIMDEDDCMVDIAKFFLTFTQDESCGKCTPCREGTKRMLEILEKICNGNGTLEDLDNLERLSKLVQNASLCGLGRAAPNPVLSTLKHYREEYEAHVVEKRCPAKKCTALVRYEIDSEKCVGCTACARACPVQCISGEVKKLHVIGQDQCIKCGRCFTVCKFGAVKRV